MHDEQEKDVAEGDRDIIETWSRLCPALTEEPQENLCQGSHDPAVNRNRYLQNSRPERYRYSNSFGFKLFKTSRNADPSPVDMVYFLVNIIAATNLMRE
jgi:hypothetical protein